MLFKINDMSIETWQEGKHWRVKVVHDDGREFESTKLFDTAPDAIDAAMRYCMSFIVDVVVTIEEQTYE